MTPLLFLNLFLFLSVRTRNVLGGTRPVNVPRFLTNETHLFRLPVGTLFCVLCALSGSRDQTVLKAGPFP